MITQEQIKDLRQRVETLERCLDIGNRRGEVKRMEEESQAPGFWDDPKAAEVFLKKMNSVKTWVSLFDKLSGAVDDVDVLMELDPEGEDIDLAFKDATEKIEALELRNMLGGEGDSLGAVLTINSGAGGTEANDWSAMLMRMYLRWCERNGYKTTITEQTDGEDVGIKSVSIAVEGDYAFGYLKIPIDRIKYPWEVIRRQARRTAPEVETGHLLSAVPVSYRFYFSNQVIHISVTGILVIYVFAVWAEVANRPAKRYMDIKSQAVVVFIGKRVVVLAVEYERPCGTCNQHLCQFCNQAHFEPQESDILEIGPEHFRYYAYIPFK